QPQDLARPDLQVDAGEHLAANPVAHQRQRVVVDARCRFGHGVTAPIGGKSAGEAHTARWVARGVGGPTPSAPAAPARARRTARNRNGTPVMNECSTILITSGCGVAASSVNSSTIMSANSWADACLPIIVDESLISTLYGIESSGPDSVRNQTGWSSNRRSSR